MSKFTCAKCNLELDASKSILSIYRHDFCCATHSEQWAADTIESQQRDIAELTEGLSNLYESIVFDIAHDMAYTKAAKLIAKHSTKGDTP